MSERIVTRVIKEITKKIIPWKSNSSDIAKQDLNYPEEINNYVKKHSIAPVDAGAYPFLSQADPEFLYGDPDKNNI